MKIFRETFGGLLFALLSTVIVAGALILSFVEGSAAPSLPPRATETPFELPTYLPVEVTLTPTANTPTITPTTACRLPAGWVEYVVQYGDDLGGLANDAGVTPEQLREANCLVSAELVAGTVLFVPQLALTKTLTPSPSPTSSKCGPPLGWIAYRIQSSDTLFRISRIYGVSVPQLQFANCMGSSTFLRVGDLIYVPNVATRTPEFTQTGTNAPTQASTLETIYPSSTLTSTPTQDFTATPGDYPAP
ncbi:predicted glycosyl hydrolase [Longilinea arvoryzae]|uniref:Predicted glycosyl hydrolase n=1 Tax=Longilinea arvoryzae TaxID=360412 RepID=A0A0S7BFL1_9CHLR|nr:LysM peptidoglycan-binding domain-containing protein [Longilinea arvoryzae]GAP14381.1 predicted glycosyl hydrolase [Longilinea arvoryzae]